MATCNVVTIISRPFKGNNIIDSPTLISGQFESCRCVSTTKVPQSEIDQEKIQRGLRKIRTGSDSDQPKAQLNEELQPNPQLFEVNSVAGRSPPSSDFVRTLLSVEFG